MTITEDKFWGWVLIAIGVVALTFQPFDKLDVWLKGKPNRVLTYLLVAIGLFYIGVAFLAPRPHVKALAVFWAVTP